MLMLNEVKFTLQQFDFDFKKYVNQGNNNEVTLEKIRTKLHCSRFELTQTC